MITLKHIAVSNFEEPCEPLRDLYTIFSETLNKSLSYEAFRNYYLQYPPHYMDISLMQDGDKTIGFLCAAFYKQKLGDKVYTVCRGAIGIRENYRGGKLPCRELCMKYIRYKIKHPLEEMYLTGYVANPLVYAMICRHSHQVYPKAGIRVTGVIDRLVEDIIQFHGFGEKVIAPFTLKIQFQVQLAAKDEERIYTSRDRYVRHYLSMNPDFHKQVGVLTIVPVSWLNLTASVFKIMVGNPLKKFIANSKTIHFLKESLSMTIKPLLRKVMPMST